MAGPRAGRTSTLSAMLPAALLLLVATVAAPATARPASTLASSVSRRATMLDGFYNVSENGGSWLTGNTGGGPDVGEPINVVISTDSDATIIASEDVFLDFMVSVHMGEECLGQHEGNVQTMNLGDGVGDRGTITLRYDYGDPTVGTCQETIHGGNHLRYAKQNGSTAASGAWFLAVSVERNLTYHHNIITPDGYGSGRDWLTGNATLGTRSPITGRTFSTTSEQKTGFFPADSSQNINHGLVYDGLVDVWTVKITGDATATASSSGTASGTTFGVSAAATTVAGGAVKVGSASSSRAPSSKRVAALVLLAAVTAVNFA